MVVTYKYVIPENTMGYLIWTSMFTCNTLESMWHGEKKKNLPEVL